jgi:hypothetical protein
MPTDLPDDPTPERIDRDIRLNEAWHAADEMARERVEQEGLWGEDAENAIESWRNLYSYDTAPDTSEHEIFRAEGIELPDPEELDDAALTAKLWEVIHALAARNTFLSSTDHLSDRQLYTHLVEECFHEITKDMPTGTDWTQHIDILGGCSDEDMQLYLRYYADDEFRQEWARDWDGYAIPPKEKPPYDRDRHLPKERYE